MAAGYLDLFIEQGETFSANVSLDAFNGTAFNLSEYAAKGEIRKSHWSENYSALFGTSISANTGTINLRLSAQTTQNLDSGRYVYDVFITNTNTSDRTKVLEGILFLEASSTKI